MTFAGNVKYDICGAFCPLKIRKYRAIDHKNQLKKPISPHYLKNASVAFKR